MISIKLLPNLLHCQPVVVNANQTGHIFILKENISQAKLEAMHEHDTVARIALFSIGELVSRSITLDVLVWIENYTKTTDSWKNPN